MRFPRIGIRGKILLSYGATIALVVAIEVLAQNSALGIGRRYEERLARYYSIQGLRSALAELRALGERYMRERQGEQRVALDASLESLSASAKGVAPSADEPQEAFFEVRAARRGIEAYLPLARKAFAKRESGLPDAYQDYQKADRIAAYVDGYLGRLLSISMSSGMSHYEDSVARSATYRRFALLAIVAAGVVALFFSALFAQSIAAPVRRLAEAADRIASGDLDVEPIKVETRDEVAALARDFNAMSSNIRVLVEGLKEKAELERLVHERDIERVSMGRALREAQFMNLQDQVRPHFLFNALNTIARSALLEGSAETERLAMSLGKLMRYSLAEGGAFVSLGEELAALREYLSFQGIRFGARLAWEIRSDPRVEALAIPRFTLQPIVENAVRHGIEPKVEGGRVVVSARRKAGRVRLVVADSGVGMDAVLVRPGIADLETRLAFRYQGSVGLAVASRPGRGTIVRITLPAPGAADAV